MAKPLTDSQAQLELDASNLIDSDLPDRRTKQRQESVAIALGDAGRIETNQAKSPEAMRCPREAQIPFLLRAFPGVNPQRTIQPDMVSHSSVGRARCEEARG